jgi:DNA-binding transcriptional LysR family regulator
VNLRQLQYLDAVGQLGSFSAAARRLHVVQPAVSQQIRKLEAELGLDLVTRATPATLTAAGERVARHARAALNAIDAIRAEAAQPADTLSGPLAIGAMHWLGHIDVPAILAAFAQAHPRVNVSLRESTSPQMLEAVRRGELDVTFLSLSTDDAPPRGVALAELETEPLLIAGSPAALPAPDPLHLRFLHDRAFVAFAPNMNLRATVDAALAHHDVHPRIVLESNEPLTVRNLAAAGLGYALLPAGVAHAPGPAIATAPIHPPGVTRRLCLAWRADRHPSPAAARFIAAAKRALR